MALRHDACRLELERIEVELKRFSEDPEIAAKRVSADLKKVEETAANVKDDRLRAETRIQGLMERRPYATVNDSSERLAVLEDQIAREQRRMDALDLLQKTLQQARAELMVEVAAPVERIATDYLEEICGRPLGEIRLTRGLTAEAVVPASFTDEEKIQVALDRFSGGEREQIFFCTRLALGTQLARRERQMVVLDDALTFTDDDRMRRVCGLLSKVGDRLQVVILTCHPERFANLPGANRIELMAALGRERVSLHV
jgi:DNA repair exonuclease SbcCD ATPase subunit